MNDRIYRSVDDRVIAGVCGGLAVRFALDPSLVRVLWVVVALVTGVFPLLVLYVIMAVVVPEEPGGFAGIGPSPTPPDVPASPVDATIPGAPAPAAPPPTWYGGPPGSRPGRRERRERDPLPAAIGGLVLVALGAYFLVRDRIAVDWGVVGAAGLIALGAVVILAALRPRR
ncbi:MAG: PspC domain-containing protein [Chloroflexota bacterium]